MPNTSSARPSTPPPTHPAIHPAPSPAPSPLPKRPKPEPTRSADSHSAPATPTTAIASSAPETAAMSNAPLTNVADSPPLLIKKLVAGAKAPTRGSAAAAGYDVYAAAPATIPARGKGLVSTGLAIAVPAGTYGRVAPRSGLASKNFIDTGAGVIDADYRGEVKVLLFNHADSDFEVKEGDRIAQLILERIYTPDVVVVEELEESIRGAGGFGSTG